MDNNTFENFSAQPAEQQPPVQEPQPQTPEPAAGDVFSVQAEKPVHTGIFFGLEALFALPLIGLISSVIFSFVPENKNLKNYARAKMIWCLISLLLTVLMIVGCVIAVQKATEYIESKFAISEEQAEQIESLFDAIDNIGALAGIVGDISSSESLSGLIEQIGGVENIGEIIDAVGGMENLGEIVGAVGDMENIGALIEQAGGMENVGELIEQAGGMEKVEEIIEQAGGVENFGEIVDAVGAENLSGIESIEDIRDIAEQIEDPEIKDRILDIIRQNGG